MADFIITTLQPWELPIGSTIKNTAVEIAKRHRVLYVNPPADFASRLRGLLRSGKPGKLPRKTQTRRVGENLWVMDCPFTLYSVGPLPRSLFDIFCRKNGKKLGKEIRKQAEALGFTEYIHLIDTDLFRSRYLKEYLRPAISIYYRRDYVIGFPYWRKNGPHCEEALVRQSDIVLANSSYFAAQLKPLNPNTYTLNTGVNLELYDASKHWEQPADMQSIPLPLIGYTGAIIESRLDSKLLYNLAKRLPSYSFVFVGPEDEHFRHHPLHRLDNVYFLGRKEVEQLPQYIRHFTVCINPQILNPITDGNYPLKIDEYLAMGKPVVATSTHTMRDVFAAHVHLADCEEEWVASLRKAVSEKDDLKLSEERIAFAHTHSWGHSVETIYQAIRETTVNGQRLTVNV